MARRSSSSATRFWMPARSSPCRRPRIRPRRSRRCARTSSASSSTVRSVIPKLYNGKDKTFFMASYEGFRLVQQSTSLSTQMPADFLQRQFLAGARIEYYRRMHQGSAERQHAVSRQHHPDGPHLAGGEETAAVLSRRRISPAWRAISPCRCRHTGQLQPDRGPDRSEHRRQDPALCTGPLAEMERVRRQRDPGQRQRLRRPRLRTTPSATPTR